MERPIGRMAYRHLSGEVFVVWGFANDKKELRKASDELGEELVILSSLKDASTWYFPLSKFWDKHPQTQKARFELVTPV